MPAVDRSSPGDELGLVAPAKTLRLIHLLRRTLDELARPGAVVAFDGAEEQAGIGH